MIRSSRFRYYLSFVYYQIVLANFFNSRNCFIDIGYKIVSTKIISRYFPAEVVFIHGGGVSIDPVKLVIVSLHSVSHRVRERYF